tara:strand:+ start:210 stop:470 length:261 start_codon:yes stop_codon:yes gene_type:complete
MASIFDRIKPIIADKLVVDEDKIELNKEFAKDLNADSLDLVELVMALEEEFSTGSNKIEIADEDAENILSVQNAVDYLREHGVDDS